MKKIYNSKWFPRLFSVRPDGGKDSGVTAYFLIEWKPVFSIGILHFKNGSREAFHTHAFHAITWWLKGEVTEHRVISPIPIIDGKVETITKKFKSSFKPKFTSRDNLHKIESHGNTYALTFRGRWVDYWFEFRGRALICLTNGRKTL
jgi:hypothetical protein